MTIYFILMALISGFYIALRKKRKLFFIVTGMLVFLIIGLRDVSVGSDTQNYVGMYLHNTEIYVKSLSTGFFSVRNLLLSDYLYFIYCYILLSLGFSERMFLIVSAGIMVLLIFRFFYKYSNNDYICILTFLTIGMFTFLFSGIRQGLAVSIFTLSYKYIIEQKPFKFVISTMIAMGFHVSTIAAIPAYLLVKLLKERKSDYSVFICCVIGFFASSVFLLILNMFSLGTRFSVYFNADAVKTNPLIVILYLGIAVLCVVLQKSRTADFTDYEVDKKFLVMFGIGLGIVIISLQNTMIFRFAYCYLLALPIVLGNSIKRVRPLQERMVYFISCVAIELLFFLITVPNSLLYIADYKFFWQ